MHVHNRRTFLASAGAAAVGALVPSFGSAQNVAAINRDNALALFPRLNAVSD